MSAPQPENTSFRVGLTQEERELYSWLFKALDPESSGIVTSEKARATFEKSGLPANILGEIWQLADSKNLGFLTQFGFCHAMRLIGYTQAGHYPTVQLAETPGPLPKFVDMPSSSQPLMSQSTSGSLLQVQPSALIPQNTSTRQSIPQAPIAGVSPDDFEKFSQIFVKTTGSKLASLDGSSAKLIFMKAKLPTATLGQIWSLVDVGNRGFLDLPSFVMAMHLIHGMLSGALKQFPPFLPEYVWKSVEVPGNFPPQGDRQASYSLMALLLSTMRHPPPQQQQQPPGNSASGAPSLMPSEWQASTLQKLQYDAMFDSLDKAKAGQLAADQVASFLMTSRLDQQDLATIWDLADIQNTGIFSKLEFGIALFLINRKRSGLALPDVVPQDLIASLLHDPSSPVSGSQLQPQSQLKPASLHPVQASVARAEAPAAQPKSSLDELADIFSSPSPTPGGGGASLSHSSPQRPGLQARASSSDLTHSHEPPKVRLHLMSSFKPSSTFGQSLVGSSQDAPEHTNLIGDDVVPSEKTVKAEPVTPPAHRNTNTQLSNLKPAELPETKQRTVDYEALRSVPAPPPPQARSTHTLSFGADAAPPKPTNYEAPRQARDNTDLLADSEISGKLSQATSDIANFSNQIKSLTTQTSNLHEKNIRAEKELARILAVKEEINTKLKLLRMSYASEVKLVEQVEKTLNNSREELEALRSEASIAEAKFNSISNDFYEKQLAVDDSQKVNLALREKLGNLNAEISALESEHERKTTENVRLSNDVNVKKSQVQVALVKVDELRRKISEAETSHENYTRQIKEYEDQRLTAEMEAAALYAKNGKLEHSVKELQQKHLSLAASAKAEKKSNGVSELVQDAPHAIRSKSFRVQSTDQKEDPPVTPENTQNGSSRAVNEESNAQSSVPSFAVAGMVDEVKHHPTEDLTGLDDVQTVEQKDMMFEQANLESSEQRFPPVSPNYRDSSSPDYTPAPYQEGVSKNESVSSAATGSYKQVDGGEVGETPITSPANSEYRFQSSNAGVVGGMMGMPGVLVGVQRTESLTSSVQNNPSMSVRDDNIDDMSDRNTLEDTPVFLEHPNRNPKQSEGHFEESSEGERLSFGVELFEDEVKGIERAKSPTHPLAKSYRASELSSGSGSQQMEEFPPVKELDYDESSSESDENVAMEDEFDDAKDNFASQTLPPAYDSASEFNDLKPATVEKESSSAQDEFFDEDFDNLKLANDDQQEEADMQKVLIDDRFTGADDLEGFNQQGHIPDFTNPPSGAHNENDEWERLFAGFGNAAPVSEAQPQAHIDKDSPHESAIQELVAMGFEETTVVEALEKENYDVEAATNYLLDHA